MSVCLITWDGPCERHGKWHACKRGEDHQGRHVCGCTATSMALLNPRPAREPVERFYQRIPPRTRQYTKRDPAHYFPKYMKRKRGLL